MPCSTPVSVATDSGREKSTSTSTLVAMLVIRPVSSGQFRLAPVTELLGPSELSEHPARAAISDSARIAKANLEQPCISEVVFIKSGAPMGPFLRLTCRTSVHFSSLPQCARGNRNPYREQHRERHAPIQRAPEAGKQVEAQLVAEVHRRECQREQRGRVSGDATRRGIGCQRDDRGEEENGHLHCPAAQRVI